MSKSESIIKNTKAEILNSLKSSLQVITETGKDGEVYFHDVISNAIDTNTPQDRKVCLDLIDKADSSLFDTGLIDNGSIDRVLITSAYCSIEQILFNDDFIQELQTALNNETISKKQAENIIKKISENADGSARTALTMLEQIIGLKNESDMLEVVERFTINEKEVIELCRALLYGKVTWSDITVILKGINDEPERVRLAVLGYCNSVLLNPKSPNEKKSGNAQAALIINCFSQPFYSAGKTLLTNACYEVICG